MYASVMRLGIPVLTLVLGLGCAASQAPPTCPERDVEVDLPTGTDQIAARATEIVWGPCPPALPASCEMAVLEGDPKSETLFTVRFQTRTPFELKPHWHPRHERVTILQGRVGIGFGDKIDRAQVTWFGPGDYYVNAKDAPHFVLVDGPAVLQVTGIGPWGTNYLEPG